MNAVVVLREALNEDFTKLGEFAMRIVPGLDGATFGSVLILYGIETTLYGADTPPETLAAHLRNIADALERGDSELPVLTGLPPSAEAEPAF